MTRRRRAEVRMPSAPVNTVTQSKPEAQADIGDRHCWLAAHINHQMMFSSRR